MADWYRVPITKEYNTRGCIVNINAAENSERVSITVTNTKTNNGRTDYYIMAKHNEKEWYSSKDILSIQNMVNTLLDEFGDTECNEIHFTNQILS